MNFFLSVLCFIVWFITLLLCTSIAKDLSFMVTFKCVDLKMWKMFKRGNFCWGIMNQFLYENFICGLTLPLVSSPRKYYNNKLLRINQCAVHVNQCCFIMLLVCEMNIGSFYLWLCDFRLMCIWWQVEIIYASVCPFVCAPVNSLMVPSSNSLISFVVHDHEVETGNLWSSRFQSW